jgi:CubicO group peptidase (beta-lactamase class C family)
MRTLLLLLPLCGSTIASAQTLQQRVDAYFATAVASGDFAGSLLIARGDSVLVNKSYGLANIELNVPATARTRYIIASLTKTITAAAIVRLRDQGKLRLDDTLSRYLPAFPYASRITLLHLLGHASGLSNPDYAPLFGRQVGLAELLDSIGKLPLQFPPGTDSRYSNAGYNVLAAVIEKVTGQPYGVAIQSLVLGPAGMTASGDASDGAVIPALATPYVAGPGPSHARVAEGNYSADIGGGSVFATTGDLFRWARVIQTDRLFKVSSLPYMYGWGQRKLAGGRWLEQTGLLDGWTSNIYVGLDTVIVVVVLGNHCTPSFGRWGRELAQVVMGQADSVKPLTAELPGGAREPRVDPAQYLGSFKSDQLSLRVTSSGSALYAEVSGWPVARYLAPSGTDRFVVGDFGMEISFTRDAQGKVTGIAWGSGDGALTLKRQ